MRSGLTAASLPFPFHSFVASLLFLLATFSAIPLQAQNSEQLEVGPPPLHRAAPPAAGASAEELEKRGDELRTEKNFLDALDFYQAILQQSPGSLPIYRKIGVCQLMMQRYKDAKKSFEKAIHADRKDAIAYNNLGVVYYSVHNYNAAIKHYDKAISFDHDTASYYSNLGAAYFAKKQFDKAVQNYTRAVEIDPDIFERTSHAGVMAQLPSPEDRAHYDYVLAKLYARSGVPERSLHYLKKAMEEGYKGIKNVYKDEEFSSLRKDPRFTELMAAKTTAIAD
jgi:tetratricopeptide (TPR) repeat protein